MRDSTNRTLTAAALLMAVSCAPDRTMLVVRIQSNMTVPDALDQVRVVVKHGGKEIQNIPFPLRNNTRRLPLEVALLSPSGGGTDVAITVTGLLSGRPVVSEDAITSFIKGKSLLIDMFLAGECVDFDCMDPAKTCTVGQVCIDRKRAADTLPAYVPLPRDAGADKGDATDGPPSNDGRDGTGLGGAGGGGGSAAAGAGGTGTDAGGDAKPDAKADAFDAPVVEVAPEVPACVPTTENCFNDKDDDCDGRSDCADTDCTPTAVCVPRPSGAVGTTVDNMGPCPTGFGAGITQLQGSLMAPTSCASGCSCGAGTTTCSADLFTHTDQASCGNNTGGKFVYRMSTADPDKCPIPDMNTTNVWGARLSPWLIQTGGCLAGGAPVKPSLLWGKSTRFCAADRFNAASGNGCMTGYVCAPKGAPGRSCALLDSPGNCPAPAVADLLYTGATDTRVCPACTCSAAGASCNNVTVKLGSDYSCDANTGTVRGGMASCVTQLYGVYVPGYSLVGAPTPPTCVPTSTASGAATPTGGRTLCCVP